MPQKIKKNKKTKKISFILNRVIEDYKKKQKSNEKKEIKLREELVKKENQKNLQRAKEFKIREEEFKKKEDQIKKRDEDLRRKDQQLRQKDDDLELKIVRKLMDHLD